MTIMWLFAAVMLAGIGLGIWALTRRGGDGGRAHEILAERLALGEISPDEYRARRDTIGRPSGRHVATLGIASVTLIVLGLVGGLVAAATTIGPTRDGTDRMMSGRMDRMMDGRMRGMMRGMMDGDTGRDADPPEPGAREISIEGDEFSFEPDEIRLERGETVNIVFDNQGRMFHTFTVAALDFELRADRGQEISGSLRPTETGRFRAVCTVPGHIQGGMTATVIVEG